jgi:hypothetical protein
MGPKPAQNGGAPPEDTSHLKPLITDPTIAAAIKNAEKYQDG